MRLKDYQQETLETLAAFLALLDGARADDLATRKALAGVDAVIRAGLEAGLPDPVSAAWVKAQAEGVAASPDPWRPLADGHGKQVPHVCLNLPTGSGKTLIAGHAVGRILTGLDKAMTGFVLWVMPSDAIYKQTRSALRDRGHAVRQALEIASGGRLKLVEKGGNFTRADVESGLVVMTLMLQSARAKKESSEQKTRKVFREGCNYASFFPDGDDRIAAQALKARLPNLEMQTLADGAPGAVVQSLANTLRLIHPIIVMDEGHTAYSIDRRRLLGDLNPRFMLELTATPAREHSNILVKIGGKRLRDAQMIKAGIELTSDSKADWKGTLKAALDQREKLETAARVNRARSDRYIRPIMLVRVERTGKDQRDGVNIHTEDVYEELTNQLGVPADWVRRQTAVDKELDDQLLCETSPVRIIITKDALREGWDCPFASVLALLSRTQAKTAMTQMIGRVMRQPYVTYTGDLALDSAWVFCCDLGVQDAVEAVRKGLDDEGMGDLRDSVRGADVPVEMRKVERRAAFKAERIFVPTVTHADVKGGFRALDFDADILGALDWSALRYGGAATLDLSELGGARARARARLDYGASGQIERTGAVAREELATRLDRPDLARRLLGVIPNPWVAMRLVDAALAVLRGRGIADTEIAKGRLDLIDSMVEALREQVDALARAVFEAKLAAGTIAFRLRGKAFDWEPPHSFEMPFRPGTDMWEVDDHSDRLKRSLFEDGIKQGEMNPTLERPVALYLDGNSAVAWWWRLTARRDWGLQGWRRNRVYPDFLLQLNGEGTRLLVLETKGKQLAGNEDTTFKNDLMAALEGAYAAPSPGEVELFGEGLDAIRFRMLMQTGDWRPQLAGELAG